MFFEKYTKSRFKICFWTLNSMEFRRSHGVNMVCILDVCRVGSVDNVCFPLSFLRFFGSVVLHLFAVSCLLNQFSHDAFYTLLLIVVVGASNVVFCCGCGGADMFFLIVVVSIKKNRMTCQCHSTLIKK